MALLTTNDKIALWRSITGTPDLEPGTPIRLDVLPDLANALEVQYYAQTLARLFGDDHGEFYLGGGTDVAWDAGIECGECAVRECGFEMDYSTGEYIKPEGWEPARGDYDYLKEMCERKPTIAEECAFDEAYQVAINAAWEEHLENEGGE